ncbi:MAG: Holliday junction branch migration protein RuvA [Candidatus Campbellbacteria bacterium]|nr:Holliday junction branch migration protein RuvA [Candidatus Campbellbacteria bacterium]
MIGHIFGKVINKDGFYLTIDVGGVGYMVVVSTKVFLGVKVGEDISLWIRTCAKDNDITLFGFGKKEDRAFFDMLLQVSGVGPKTAMSIVATTETKELSDAIAVGDAELFSELSGVRKKMSEKITLELKNKIGDMSTPLNKTEEEVIEALVSLGYERAEARRAQLETGKEGGDVSERIKRALSLLNNKR